MYYNNPVTGRLSFEKFVIRRDFRKTNLHAEETHRGFSSHYIFSLGCFCTNKYNNATRSWKLLINWDWKPLSNSVWIPSSVEINLCFPIFITILIVRWSDITIGRFSYEIDKNNKDGFSSSKKFSLSPLKRKNHVRTGQAFLNIYPY